VLECSYFYSQCKSSVRENKRINYLNCYKGYIKRWKTVIDGLFSGGYENAGEGFGSKSQRYY
jgi:hypothetical protein